MSKLFKVLKWKWPLFVTALLLLRMPADAYLGGFETTDGYASSDVGTALASYPPYQGRYVGPEVQLYNAGDLGGFTDIADNSGLWQNIYGAGTQGRYKIWDPTSNADATYLSGHFNPYGTGGLLAIRASDNRSDQGQSFGVTGAFDTQWAYTIDSLDLHGVSPDALLNQDVNIQFQLAVGAQWHQPVQGGTQLSFVENHVVMFAIGLGGSYAQPAVDIGVDDLQHFRYQDSSGTWADSGILVSHNSFDQVLLTMHFTDQTYDLSLWSSLDNLTHPIVSGLGFATNIGGSIGQLTLTTYADPEGAGTADDHGLGKTYLDSFNFIVSVPEPGSMLLCLCGSVLGFVGRRK